MKHNLKNGISILPEVWSVTGKAWRLGDSRIVRTFRGCWAKSEVSYYFLLYLVGSFADYPVFKTELN